MCQPHRYLHQANLTCRRLIFLIISHCGSSNYLDLDPLSVVFDQRATSTPGQLSLECMVLLLKVADLGLERVHILPRSDRYGRLVFLQGEVNHASTISYCLTERTSTIALEEICKHFNVCIP